MPLDDIYKQLTSLQRQIDNLVKPEIPTVSELDLLYLQIVNNLSDVANDVTAFDNIKQDATDSYTGVVELATQAEVNAGTDTTRYVSPATLTNWSGKPVVENLLADTLTNEASQLAGTTFNDLADDNYSGALWNILNDANAPDVSMAAGGATDPFTRYLAITLDATTRVGAVQFISAEKSKEHRGEVVSLSADLWATGITAARMAVIIWTSTADTVTSDVVSSWASNPTLATNWAYIGTPADITISSTRARYNVPNLTIPTNTNNIGVFIWTPSQEASTDVLNIARVKLEPGMVATDFVGRDPGEELRLVNRHYCKSYAVGTAPATNTLVNMAAGEAINTSVVLCYGADFPVTMRTTPTVTIYSVGGTTSKISTIVPADIGTTVTGTNLGDRRIPTVSDSGAGLTAGTKYLLHFVADARL